MTTQLHNGDRVSYGAMEALDDIERDDQDSELRSRDLCRIDNGTGYVIGWYYAIDGTRLDAPVVSESQPLTGEG